MSVHSGHEGKGYIAQRGQQGDAQNTLSLLRPPAMNVHTSSVPAAAPDSYMPQPSTATGAAFRKESRRKFANANKRNRNPGAADGKAAAILAREPRLWSVHEVGRN